MASQSEARRRLAVLMDERRLDLKLTWQAVAEQGDVSLRALAMARSGDSEIRPLTRRGIDRGLQWVEGCGVDNILAGHKPLTATLGPLLPAAENFARSMGIDPADPADPVILAVRQEVNRAELEHGEGVAGEKVFHGQSWSHIEADIWDDPGISRESKVLAVAGLRVDRAQHQAGHSGTAGLASAVTTGSALSSR